MCCTLFFEYYLSVNQYACVKEYSTEGILWTGKVLESGWKHLQYASRVRRATRVFGLCEQRCQFQLKCKKLGMNKSANHDWSIGFQMLMQYFRPFTEMFTYELLHACWRCIVQALLMENRRWGTFCFKLYFSQVWVDKGWK